MAANREPRRVARMGWAVETHLGELDADVDELHLLRQQDKDRHEKDMARMDKKLDGINSTLRAAALAGFTAAVGLIANILLKTLV